MLNVSSEHSFNWKPLPLTTWNRGTLKTLVDCAYLICQNIGLRKKEIDHLKVVSIG